MMFRVMAGKDAVKPGGRHDRRMKKIEAHRQCVEDAKLDKEYVKAVREADGRWEMEIE